MQPLAFPQFREVGMEELIIKIKQAYTASEKAFSHDQMPFDDRITNINLWYSVVTPENIMRLVNCLEKGGYTPPTNGEGRSCNSLSVFK